MGKQKRMPASSRILIMRARQRAWANWYDGYSADYLIVGGETPTVQVMREDETEARAVLVMGETTRTYSGHLAA